MKKGLAFLLALILCLTIVPAAAFAAGETSSVTETNKSAYLEHYYGGLWYDIDTPAYSLEDGSVAYALDNTAAAPGSATYTKGALRTSYSSAVSNGIEIIIENGYPKNVPSGMTNEQARQATANAIFFWLSEQGVTGSSTYANRKADPSLIRAKSGHEAVLTFADSLLNLAREQKHMKHSIAFSKNPLTLAKGTPCSGTASITLTNCAAGYEMDAPSNSTATVSGNSGSSGDTLNFTGPSANGGTSYTVTFKGKDARVAENISLYTASGKRNMVAFKDENKVAATETITVNIPGEGQIRVTKYNASYLKAQGVSFTVYKDPTCTDAVTTVTTDSKGVATTPGIPVGTYYVKETNTQSPMVLESTVRTVNVLHGTTQSVIYSGTDAKGKIRITNTASQITSLNVKNTSYGKEYTSVLSAKGLQGAVYEIYDSNNDVVEELTTNTGGIAESEALSLGTYTVVQKSVPSGYQKDSAKKTVTLSYLNMNTPFVEQNVNVVSVKLPASVKMKKLTERFNTSTKAFEEVNGANFVFGLYTADAIGIIGKDTLVDVLTTDTNGEAVSDAALAFGNYYIRELSVPEDTIEVHEESYPLTVSGENTTYLDTPVKNDMFKANIGINLTDAESGAKLSGGVYEVKNASGELYCEMTTGEDGYALSCSLPVGEYKVKEITPPVGYNVSDEVIDVSISTKNKTTLVFDRTNTKNRISILRTDAVTASPIQGITITVYDESGNVYTEIITDAEGKADISGIPFGSYTYLETVVPKGYTKDAAPKPFSISEAGVVTGGIESGTLSPTAVTVHVQDLYHDTAFASVSYRIKDKNGETVKTKLNASGYREADVGGEETFRVGSTGDAEIRYIGLGNYSFEESTPVGFISNSPFAFTISDSTTVAAPASVTSELTITALQIYSSDASSGNPLSAIGFKMKTKNGGEYTALKFTVQEDGSYILDENGPVDTLMADGSGRITVYGLPLGDVWVEEAVRPDGYFPMAASKVEMNADTTSSDPLVLNLSSSKYIKLGLDSDWWEFPALCLGILLLVGSVVFFIVFYKKKNRKDEENQKEEE